MSTKAQEMRELGHAFRDQIRDELSDDFVNSHCGFDEYHNAKTNLYNLEFAVFEAGYRAAVAPLDPCDDEILDAFLTWNDANSGDITDL